MQTLRVCVRSGLRPDTLSHFRGRERFEKTAVAIYHLSVKTISRSAGRSATAAAAYRSGVKIEDEHTGEIHDYTRKGGVESKALVLPPERPEWATNRAKLWNMAEGAETRKNSTVAREFEIALPAELTPAQRKALAVEFALEIVQQHKCAADVAIHAPGKEGDNRNHHAHILLSTRRLTAEGFTEKTRELDDKKLGSLHVKHWRERFAFLQNLHLAAAGHDVRVDHRTLEAQGIDRAPTVHLGPAATAIERRTGQPSWVRQDRTDAGVAALVEKARLGKQIDKASVGIADLEQQLNNAKAEKAKEAIKPKDSSKTQVKPTEDLSPGDQVKVWDLAIQKGVNGIQKKIERVAIKANQRSERRQQKARQIEHSQPPAPRGLLGMFKQKAYEAALESWSANLGYAKKLEVQADRLSDRLHDAYQKVQSKVYQQLTKRFPEWSENVSKFKQAQRLEQVKERAAQKEVRSQARRGHDRGMSR